MAERTMAQQAADLRRLADELDEPAAAVDWTVLAPEAEAGLRDEIAAWITRKLQPMYGEYLDEQLRDCWPRHPSVCTELGQLYREWSRIFDRDKPLLPAALAFSDRLLPLALGRIGKLMTRCSRKCRISERGHDVPAP